MRAAASTSHGHGPALAELPRPVAIVLSGGGSLGALQAGQLRALTELGLRPDLIVGTSVGAINGLFMASDFSLSRAKALVTLWRGLRRRDVFGGLGVGSLLRLVRGRDALASARPLAALAARVLPARLEDLAIPTHVVAVDCLTGLERVLSGGDLRRNALASAAIPGVFPPVVIDGRALVDGGLVANVPLLQAAHLGAKTMIVCDASFPCSLPRPPDGVIAAILHALALALRNQARLILPLLAPKHTVLYLPAPCPLAVAPHDFSQTDALIEAGYELALDFMSRVDPAVRGTVGHPHTHDHD